MPINIASVKDEMDRAWVRENMIEREKMVTENTKYPRNKKKHGKKKEKKTEIKNKMRCERMRYAQAHGTGTGTPNRNNERWI